MAVVSHFNVDGVNIDVAPATPPTVGNGTLIIQKNGTNVQTFTANQTTNSTANITVPTKTSELSNDSGYITNAGVTGVKGSAESTYRTGNVNLSKTNVGLGNVPNVTTNNQTPTFSQASTRDNLVSGEKLSVLFGKIMKFFADLKTVAFSGAYSDLSGLPTIPTVNNATLTIQKNGTNVQTFTANASSNKTANITVPTKVSELTNDSGFITNSSEASVITGTLNSTYFQSGTITATIKGNICSVIIRNINVKSLISSYTTVQLGTLNTGIAKHGNISFVLGSTNGINIKATHVKDSNTINIETQNYTIPADSWLYGTYTFILATT